MKVSYAFKKKKKIKDRDREMEFYKIAVVNFKNKGGFWLGKVGVVA